MNLANQIHAIDAAADYTQWMLQQYGKKQTGIRPVFFACWLEIAPDCYSISDFHKRNQQLIDFITIGGGFE